MPDKRAGGADDGAREVRSFNLSINFSVVEKMDLLKKLEKGTSAIYMEWAGKYMFAKCFFFFFRGDFCSPTVVWLQSCRIKELRPRVNEFIFTPIYLLPQMLL